MNLLCAGITAGGAFAVAPESSPPESHLGCDVLFRGYLADRGELRNRFGLSAADRPTDHALIAHAFRTWGDQLQAHVTGEFAAAVFDSRARTALLTHDALGMESLFYVRRSGGLRFAGDLIDLLDAHTSAVLDEDYIADYLAYGYVTGERTPYPAIRRLLPGRSLRWCAGRITELRTWDPSALEPIVCRDDGEYEERLRALLDAGVRGALDGVERAGVALSGGLDSSTIACVAPRDERRHLAAYSFLCPRWPQADEEPWMRAVVEHAGLPWHTFDTETVLPFSRPATEFLGEPTMAVVDEARRRLYDETLASHGVSVLLNGDGGDTVLCTSPGPMPRHLADPLFDGNPVAALASLLRWKNGALERRSLSYWVLRALVAPAAAHLRSDRVRSERIPFPEWIANDYALATGLQRRGNHRLAAPRVRHPGRQALWDDLWIAGVGMTAFPRRRLAYSLRLPLMYRPLVEFMASIPWEQKLRPRCDRWLHRRALKGVLPELVRRRGGKGGGTAPYVEGLRRSPGWISYLTDAPLMAERGIVDAAAWRHAVRQASVGRTNSDRYFFAGVAVETWLRQLAEHRARVTARPDSRDAA